MAWSARSEVDSFAAKTFLQPARTPETHGKTRILAPSFFYDWKRWLYEDTQAAARSLRGRVTTERVDLDPYPDRRVSRIGRCGGACMIGVMLVFGEFLGAHAAW